ncbi:serine hydrolase [Flagellimonas sp.]|uniref:serine hydrolase n=1 Tax=Flagellimonas sp. TaxID=2058762 RepID=UPI003B5ACE3E
MKITAFTLILSFLFIGATLSNAQMTKKNNPLHTKIDNYLTQGIGNGFSGAMLVVKNGKVIINEGYGMADKENGITNTPNTVFDIGSNTKQFTGAAILKLVQLGKLKTSDSIIKYFPNIPDDKENITIHQLLTHSSGLIETIGNDFDHVPTEEFFKKVFASKLLHQSGSAYAYSNIGYSILARIIELTSGETYEAFLHQHLFKPLGMMQTGYLNPNWNVTTLAKGYVRNVMNIGSTVMRYKEDQKVSWHLKGNGGINSTQNDMLKWMHALSSNTILTKSLFEAYTTPYVSNARKSFHTSYGWGITSSDRGAKRITHNGSNGGFSHTIIWIPEDELIIVYATNSNSPKVGRLAYAVEKIIFDPEFVPTPIRKNPYFLVFDFIKNHSSDQAEELYNTIEKDHKADFEDSEVFNRIGYMIMDEDITWAIELFRKNTLLFKEEGNTWDSLADAYLANGQKKEAIHSLKKAIALNYEGASEKLEKTLEKE